MYVATLTHWGRDKMDAISQTIFSRAFSSMKIVVSWLNFHWNIFATVQLTIIQHWFRLWLGAGQATSHYLNQWWLVYWRIYASLGLNELRLPRNLFIFMVVAAPQQRWRLSNFERNMKNLIYGYVTSYIYVTERLVNYGNLAIPSLTLH